MVQVRRWFVLLLTMAIMITGCAKTPSQQQPAASSTPAQTATPPANAQPATPPKPVKLRLGVAAELLAYAPINVALAKGYFKDEGLEVERTVLAGDGPANAALAAGEMEFAAITTASFIELVGKGVDRLAVYGLMNKMSMDITVSNKFLQKTGVKPSDPLETKIKAMKGATFGTLSLGGGPDVNTRYLMRRSSFDPQKDIQMAALGGAPAMLAALNQGGIDGFMLSPPTGFNVEANGQGKVLINASEVPQFKEFHFTIIATTAKYAKENPDVVRRLANALAKASDFLAKNPEEAATILKEWYPAFPAPVMVQSMKSLTDGFATKGTFTVSGWKNVIEVTKPDIGLNPETGNGKWWTNEYQPK